MDCFVSQTCLKTMFSSRYQLKFHNHYDKVDVEKFIQANIKSMTHLESLLLIRPLAQYSNTLSISTKSLVHIRWSMKISYE